MLAGIQNNQTFQLRFSRSLSPAGNPRVQDFDYGLVATGSREANGYVSIRFRNDSGYGWGFRALPSPYGVSSFQLLALGPLNNPPAGTVSETSYELGPLVTGNRGFEVPDAQFPTQVYLQAVSTVDASGTHCIGYTHAPPDSPTDYRFCFSNDLTRAYVLINHWRSGFTVHYTDAADRTRESL